MGDHCPTDCPSCVDARERKELWKADPVERHEFHMLVNSMYNAYCICGWQASENEFFHLGERYREHLV